MTPIAQLTADLAASQLATATAEGRVKALQADVTASAEALATANGALAAANLALEGAEAKGKSEALAEAAESAKTLAAETALETAKTLAAAGLVNNPAAGAAPVGAVETDPRKALAALTKIK